MSAWENLVPTVADEFFQQSKPSLYLTSVSPDAIQQQSYASAFMKCLEDPAKETSI